MRIVHEDPKLGISKVVWKFTEEPISFKMEEPESQAPPEAGPGNGPGESAQTAIEPESEPERETIPEPIVLPSGGEIAVQDSHLSDLRQQILFLQQVIESQNQQLSTKDELIRNFQVLLKTEQEQVMRLETQTLRQAPVEAPQQPGAGWFKRLKKSLLKQ